VINNGFAAMNVAGATDIEWVLKMVGREASMKDWRRRKYRTGPKSLRAVNVAAL
jgi:hypothetical protein